MRSTHNVKYYGGIGPVTAFDPLRRQQQLLFPVIEINHGPQWECNFGVGFGLTPATDRLMVKLIVGYRLALGSGGHRGYEPCSGRVMLGACGEGSPGEGDRLTCDITRGHALTSQGFLPRL